jgi:hypothetical protein
MIALQVSLLLDPEHARIPKSEVALHVSAKVAEHAAGCVPLASTKVQFPAAAQYKSAWGAKIFTSEQEETAVAEHAPDTVGAAAV